MYLLHLSKSAFVVPLRYRERGTVYWKGCLLGLSICSPCFVHFLTCIFCCMVREPCKPHSRIGLMVWWGLLDATFFWADFGNVSGVEGFLWGLENEYLGHISTGYWVVGTMVFRFGNVGVEAEKTWMIVAMDNCKGRWYVRQFIKGSWTGFEDTKYCFIWILPSSHWIGGCFSNKYSFALQTSSGLEDVRDWERVVESNSILNGFVISFHCIYCLVRSTLYGAQVGVGQCIAIPWSFLRLFSSFVVLQGTLFPIQAVLGGKR